MIQEDEGEGVMVENRFKSIEENIRDIKNGQEKLIDAFATLAVQAQRVTTLEQTADHHERWLRKINETCIARGAKMDLQPQREAPQSWWDRNVSTAVGRLVWLVLGASVGAIVARSLQ